MQPRILCAGAQGAQPLPRPGLAQPSPGVQISGRQLRALPKQIVSHLRARSARGASRPAARVNTISWPSQPAGSAEGASERTQPGRAKQATSHRHRLVKQRPDHRPRRPPAAAAAPCPRTPRPALPAAAASSRSAGTRRRQRAQSPRKTTPAAGGAQTCGRGPARARQGRCRLGPGGGARRGAARGARGAAARGRAAPACVNAGCCGHAQARRRPRCRRPRTQHAEEREPPGKKDGGAHLATVSIARSIALSSMCARLCSMWAGRGSGLSLGDGTWRAAERGGGGVG